MGNLIAGTLFQPPSTTYTDDSNLIWLETRRGNTIPAFFINRSAPITILFSHGNAEDLGGILRYFNYFGDKIHANIFAYDYSGYGLSTGEPSEEDLYADSEAAYMYVRDVLRVSWDRIVLFGRSLGSAASTHIASLTPVRGVILQCPMLSVYRIAYKLRCTLPGDKLVNIDRLKKVQAPMLIIHGTNDEVVPFWHGVKVFESRNDRFHSDCYWVQGGMHNDVEFQDKDKFLFHLNSFLDKLINFVPSEDLKNQPVII